MFTKNYFEYNRNKTTEVCIGKIPLGGNNPVRLQSMTNTDTSDTEATVSQIIELADAGTDFVRLTVQNSKIAESLRDIKRILKEKNYDIPLIADIHFSPKAAEVAAKIIEKVRINPGNYADVKQFKHINYTDEEYNAEVEKLKKNFIPLLKICKKYNTAIRIGTNHGSLSDRILSRYGDTPQGMVESTMEFLRICRQENFNDVVISMKASNPLVMIYANRLLVQTMHNEKMSFPLHLGVTEAGNELEGRIKSAVGIGSLLADGIGDTVRVSLTESPVREIPVAATIRNIFNGKKLSAYNSPFKFKNLSINFFDYRKRKSEKTGIIGGDNVPVVIADISEKFDKNAVTDCGYVFKEKDNSFEKTDSAADFFYSEKGFPPSFNFPDTQLITSRSNNDNGVAKLIDYKNITREKTTTKSLYFIRIDAEKLNNILFSDLQKFPNAVFVLDFENTTSPVHSGRVFFMKLEEYSIKNPVILKQKFDKIDDYAVLKASGESGALLIDGFGDGIWISAKAEDLKKANELSFGILQACRTRITKTEYISCPGCGRTLFDLEKTTAKIKSVTSHLKGIKIAIMGCIVNGLGEMADADYGYVGTGSGKITLYKNKEAVKKNIPETRAASELLKLIEQNL